MIPEILEKYLFIYFSRFILSANIIYTHVDVPTIYTYRRM